MNNGKFYSTGIHNEQFRLGPFDNISDALEAAYHEEILNNYDTAPGLTAGRKVAGIGLQVGTLNVHDPSVSADSIIDMLGESAADECGECAESFLTHINSREKDRLQVALDMVIIGWLHSIDEVPTFGMMEDVQRFVSNEDGTFTELDDRGKRKAGANCMHGISLRESCSQCDRGTDPFPPKEVVGE
jgi:hypothetical protein